MSTPYEIPLTAAPQYFQIPLGGVVYTITVYWCEPAHTWVFDLADGDRKPILSGIPMVTGVDLLYQHKHLGIAGKLVVQTDGPADLPPTFANLGAACRFYFIADD